MTVFTCTDTFEGILCGVYDAWGSRLGHKNVALELQSTGNIQMFTQYREVEESLDKAEKVMRTVTEKAGQEVYEQIFRASLSQEAEKADRIYRYLIYALHYGRQVLDMLQIPAVFEIFQMNRRIGNEAHYLIEFARFSQTREGTLVASVGPKNDVIILMAPHFADRLSGENWVIYDEHRKKAVVHRADGPWLMVQDMDSAWKRQMFESADQELFENLWRTFHEHIAIKERTNPVCQRTMLPLRFRPYMTEFQKDRIRAEAVCSRERKEEYG